MKDRSIPGVFWKRGKQIVNNGDVDIDEIDYSNNLVRATVIGTYRYEVTINENEGQNDFCSCPYFAEHGYCKHIAAVIEFLAKYGNPIEHLFEGEPKNVLRDIVQNKNAIDWVPETKHSNGLSFLSDIKYTEQDAFKLPNVDESDEPLMLEVTLALGGISHDDYDLDVGRLFIKLRIGSRNDQKFYAIKNIDSFLDDFNQQAIYQTGGKKRFSLNQSNFNDVDKAFLIFLSAHQRDQNFESSQFDKNQYYLIAPENLEATINVAQQVDYFMFLSTNESEYDAVQYLPYDVTSGLFSANVTSDEDGYDLKIDAQFDLELEDDNALLMDDVIYYTDHQTASKIKDILFRYRQNTHHRFGGIGVPMEVDASLHFPIGSERALIDFIKYFQQVGTVIVPDELTISPMEPQFNLDIDNNFIQLGLEFNYQSAEGTTTIHRDDIKEGMARQYLARLNFVGDDDNYSLNVMSGDQMYDFVTRQLPNLRENGVVELSNRLDKILSEMNLANPNINVSEDDGLLSVRFTIDGINENDVDAMLDQLEHNQKPFVQRQDGSIMLVDDSLRKITAVLTQLRAGHDKFEYGEIKIAAAQALSVQAMLDDTADFDEKFKHLAQDLAHPDQFDYPIKAKVQADLRQYQKDGIQWLEMLNEYHFGGILADEMGLGKTVQMIAFLLNNLVSERVNLIVAPASLTYNWQAEFEKFAPSMSVRVVDGSKLERRKIINESNSEVLITSYNSARADIAEYQQLNLEYLVLDEAQFIKNSTSKTNQALRKLTPRNAFALSGTPIENRIEELWAIFEVVMPGLLPSKKAFKHLAPAEVALRVTPFIMRREKKKVLTELPEKVESNLYNELTKEQKAVYLAQLKQMQVKVKGMSGDAFVKNKIEILAGLTRLRQICDTPALYLDEYNSDSGKINQLKEILQQAKDNDRHVLIFSQFTTMLDEIKTELNELGLDSYLLKGDTKPKERLEMVNQFNDGEKSIFLISLKAGGTGLNLTRADMVILVDLWWNPAVEDQATARAHRIGQKNNVDVFRLITKGTIEEQIFKLQEKKRNFVDQVLSGTENKASLSEAEVKEILGIE